jgi:hypothetical protein
MINSATFKATNGGNLYIDSSTVNQSAGGRISAATGSTVSLVNATIAGGILGSSGSDLFIATGTNTLANLTNDAGIQIPGGSAIYITGNLVDSGTILVNSNQAYAGTVLSFDGGTLSGSGVITLNDSTSLAQLGGSLTQAAGHTINGQGDITAALTNSGIVNANVNGQVMYLQNNITNNGTIEATNGGTLSISGYTIMQGGGGEVGATAIAGTASLINLTSSIISGGTINLGTNTTLTANGTNTISELTGNGNLNVASGTTQLPAGHGVSSLASLIIAPGATLDITKGNTLAITYGAAADPSGTIRGYLKTASNGGIWTGPGLTSSAVAAEVAHVIAVHTGGVYGIGYVDGGVDTNQASNALFKAVGNQIVYAPALIGDSNLDGSVTFIDLGIVAQNLGKNTDWNHGDFNYDGTVNFLDIGLLAQNLSKTILNTPLSDVIADPSPALTAEWNLAVAEIQANQTQPTDLPEPGMLSLLAVGAAGLLARRRRR